MYNKRVSQKSKETGGAPSFNAIKENGYHAVLNFPHYVI